MKVEPKLIQPLMEVCDQAGFRYGAEYYWSVVTIVSPDAPDQYLIDFTFTNPSHETYILLKTKFAQ